MGRDDVRGPGGGPVEDRLSAVMAGVLLAAHLAGGGVLALLKALDVPPLVSSPEEPSRVAGRAFPDPVEARPAPVGPGRWRR